VSERYLHRLFKNAHGLSPSAYVQQKRLQKACILLQHSRLPIREVASYCGFIKLPHFSTWFARQMRQSPSEFRKDKAEFSEI
jgi:transcriptional regulator GlxA family with amidase domain